MHGTHMNNNKILHIYYNNIVQAIHVKLESFRNLLHRSEWLSVARVPWNIPLGHISQKQVIN